MEADWDTRREEHEVYLGVEDAMKQLIINAYDLCWLKEIEDNFLDFTHKTEFEMLKHLLSQCLKLKNREKRGKLKNTEFTWLANKYVAIFFPSSKRSKQN